MRTARLGALVGCSLAACGGAAGPPSDASGPFTGIAVPLTSVRGLLYTAPLAVGPQTFQVQVDTGSSVTAIAACGSGCALVSPQYAPRASGTDRHQTDGVTYADGTGWSGEVYADYAAVAPAAVVTLDFVAITAQQRGFFASNAYQGLLGLGPPELLAPGTSAYAEQVAARGVPAVLGFQLCREGGQLFLGGADPAITSGAPAITPMRPCDGADPYYAVQIASLALGGASVGEGPAAFGDVLVDTGTSVSLVPTPVATALIAALDAAPGVQALFPGQRFAASPSGCVTSTAVTTAMLDSALPPLAIRFPTGDGSAPASLQLAPSRSYLYVPGDGRFCLSLVDSGGTAAEGSVLGDTLLQAFVTVFDAQRQELRFAPEVTCADAPAQAAAPAGPRGDAPWWQTEAGVRVSGARARRTR